LASWEVSTSGFLNKFGLQSIRSKIIVFALISTLIPSLAMGRLSYVNNRRFLTEKINQEIQSVTSHTSREIDLWLKERLYDIRVFASSYVVSKNLETINRSKTSKGQRKTAQQHITDYLRSVKEKFVDYEELLVVDIDKHIIASSTGRKTGVQLLGDWLKLAAAGTPIIGIPVWDEALKTGVMVVAAPIVDTRDKLLGVFAAKLNFRTLQGIIDNYSLKDSGNLYVITPDGALLAALQPLDDGFMAARLPSKTAKRLFALEAIVMEFRNYRNIEVIGTLHRIPRAGWGIVAELEQAKAYAEIFHLRNITIAFVAGILLLVGLSAYLLGLTIVGPLNRLIQGADKVASGDLEVRLPPMTGGELGFMTSVFNHMVERLRQGRDKLAAVNTALEERNIELRELSVTDSLTGLFNRVHLQESLVNELARSERHQHEFGILMLDIDHFKEFNDTFGHLAGDEILQKVASIFKSSTRKCDYVARYGGEEFFVMLPETPMDETVAAAERIRSSVENETFTQDGKKIRITISVGVSLYPLHGKGAETLIKYADEALYKAKKTGRNRVVVWETEKRKE